MNNTEFGFFAMNYHSRTPFLSLNKGVPGVSTFGQAIVEYPSDIRLYGLSASGSLSDGTALQAEYSYRPNQPVQLSAIELIVGATPNAVLMGASTLNQAGVSPTAPNGSYIQGYREVKMHQLQSTATKSFGPQLGASQLTAVGEIGLTYLDLPEGILFEGPGAGVPAASALRGGAPAVNPNGYATKRSWGYRLLTRADYPNALGSATLTPRIAFAHDVRGVGPTFNQGTQSINFGVTANWRNTWQADLSYTGFMGGRTYSGMSPLQGGPVSSSANPLKDRDFIAATVSYSF
ncbi:MAG: DUF1302 domain-containing protein [Burkholderiales bacterium]|nr:DUF1302 domain-containing protein [Burkholderiales bacterium]